jgi:hypothetical protein
VHLIVTNCREKRLEVLRNRKEHFTTSLPTVDHIAFVTNDTTFVESVLIREKVFYRRFDPEGTNITQLFIFDPDGNVVEVSSCGIPIGDTKCSDRQVSDLLSSRFSSLLLRLGMQLEPFPRILFSKTKIPETLALDTSQGQSPVSQPVPHSTVQARFYGRLPHLPKAEFCQILVLR